MNIDWKLIQEKYPKVWNKFKHYIRKNAPLGLQNGKMKIGEWDKIIEQYHWREICYCDFEDFFDDNGIRISIGIICYDYYDYKIFTNSVFGPRMSEINYKIRDEAKHQASYKAFEIMELRSKK